MTKQSNGLISQFLASRTALLEILFGAILLALGVNVIAAYLPVLLALPTGFALVFGTGLTLLQSLFSHAGGWQVADFNGRLRDSLHIVG